MTSTRKAALIAGVCFLVTHVTSVAALVLYGPVLNHPGYIVSAGTDTRVLVGGPLLFVSATAVLFGAYQQVSLPGAVAPLPVFAWELALAFFLIVKGLRTTPPGRDEAPHRTEAAAAAA